MAVLFTLKYFTCSFECRFKYAKVIFTFWASYKICQKYKLPNCFGLRLSLSLKNILYTLVCWLMFQEWLSVWTATWVAKQPQKSAPCCSHVLYQEQGNVLLLIASLLLVRKTTEESSVQVWYKKDAGMDRLVDKAQSYTGICATIFYPYQQHIDLY